jgi:hypothetical protein
MKPSAEKSNPNEDEVECTNPASFWYWIEGPPVGRKAEWAKHYVCGTASFGPRVCQIKFVFADHAKKLGFDW